MHLHQMVLCCVALAVFAGGCEAGQHGCRGDYECPGSGVCVDGECRALGGADAGVPGGGDGAALADLLTPIPDGWNPDELAASCTLNNDGVLERSEAPFLVGLGALFSVNPSSSAVTVSLHQPWDFSAAVPSERKVFDQLVAPGGAWWSGSFSGATYAEHLDDSQPLLGVFRATSTALQLLGVVSDQDGAQRTLLTYATPIDVLRFPLQVGTQWTSESDVSGTAQGIFFAAHEKYVFSADLRGSARVPAGTFDTLRLRIGYTQTYGLLVTTRITYLHLAECYGAVARIRSADNETSDDFTQASEYRRLASP